MMAGQLTRDRGQMRRMFVSVMALFFINFFEMGVLKSFSVLVDDLVIQLNTNLGTIGAIVGIYNGITYALAPFIAPFVNIMSVPLISVICAVGSMSLCLAYLASDVIQFGSVCLLSGICYSVVRLGGVILFYKNVRRNFSITFGIADTGNAIGMMTVPILTEFFLETYGWNGTILLLGGLLFQNSIFLLLMRERPLEPHDDDDDNSEMQETRVDSEAEDDVFDEDDDLLQRSLDGGRPHATTSSPSIWRCCYCIYSYFGLSLFFECRYTIVVMLLMVFLGMINASWLVFLIPHGVSRGFRLSRAVFLATCGGFGNVLGRVVQGPIIDREWMTSLDLTIIFTAINAVVFLVDPLVFNFVLLCIAAFVGGITIGARTTLTVVIAKEFFPPDTFSTVYGLQCLFYSVGEPLGGILAGWLANRFSFSVSFMVLGGVEVLTFLMLMPTRYLISRSAT
nr:monocarboxylate transporter 1-like [Lytechinus pictus]